MADTENVGVSELMGRSAEDEISAEENEKVEKFQQALKDYYFKEGGSDEVDGDLKEGGSDEVDGVSVNDTELIREAEWSVLTGIPGYQKDFIFEIEDVEISNGIKIHTVMFQKKNLSSSQESLPPIVMLHGAGGGSPSFHKILGELAMRRVVYTIDIPGFGLSSRIIFPNDVQECEILIIKMIEEWRKKKDLNNMILCGHSLGGYICAIYAIKNHKHVHHLVLMDPWGLLPKAEWTVGKSRCYKLTIFFIDKFGGSPQKHFLKLGHLIGGWLINVYMGDTKNVYGEHCMEYFRKAATTGELTGVKALVTLSNRKFDYPVLPLKQRLIEHQRSSSLPITFLYGEKSPYKNLGGEQVKNQAAKGNIVNVKYVEEAGHHLHVENPKALLQHFLEVVLMIKTRTAVATVV